MNNCSLLLKLTLLAISFFFLGCEENKRVKSMPQQEPMQALDWHTDKRLMGQKVYVPIYSSVRANTKTQFIHLTATLSIHNISPKSPIIISKIEYYDINGKFIRSFIDQPFALGPLATKEFVVDEKDVEGGTGASAVVIWESEFEVAIPIVESISISTYQGRGLSFVSRGKEIEHHL